MQSASSGYPIYSPGNDGMKRNLIVERIIDSGLIEPQSAVIIGLSGGPDSLCLLHALASIADAYDLVLVPVHINHMLRPEAESEADHAADICERLDLDCKVFEAPCSEIAREMGISTEEAGRNLRYQIYDEVARELEEQGIPKERISIALGHNADDQAETVLFRLIRGTGPHGLSGIPPLRFSEKGYVIVRPLIETERSDIEAYIRDNRLKPNIDKSNSENTYTRNRIRNQLIPYLEENYNPKIKEHLRRYAKLASADDNLLGDIAFGEYMNNMYADDESGKAVIDISVIKNDPLPITGRIVSLTLNMLGLEQLTTYENISAITDLIYRDKPSAGVDLPLGFRAQREYDKLIFSTGEEEPGPDQSLQIYPQIVLRKDFDPDEDSAYAAFDFDKFDKDHPGRLGDISLRTRHEGDYLPMRNGSKKIQDLLVDSKVRKAARGSILMACIDSEVLWVLPSLEFAGDRERAKGRFSSKFNIDETTKRILLIELVTSI